MTVGAKKLVGAVDQGTTSTRFMIFDEDGAVVASHQIEFKQHYPQRGWIEHDPLELLDSVKTCIEHAVTKLAETEYEPSDVISIGITNQRETTVVWDKETGDPLYPAIVWADGRTEELVEKLSSRHNLGKDVLQEVCGLPLTTYFSAVKLRWLLDNVPAVEQAYENERLYFGTVDTWLIFNLTGGRENGGVLVTDVTNASRTMLMDIKSLKWSEKAISFFGFQKLALPKIVSSSEVYGKIAAGSLQGVRIAGCLGDQQAALVGQTCFEKGDAKSTYGTGCFMLFNTGEEVILSHRGLLTTVAYQFGSDQRPVYCLEGSVAVAGSSVNWLRDNLGLIKSAGEINTLAEQVEDTAGVYFVPAFAGLFAPYWRADARGTICGLTQYSNRGHIARATLEAVCYQARAILDAMNKESKAPLRTLNVDGGMSNSDLCMQIQADILGISVRRPKMSEATALGSAFAAGFAVGVWSSMDELKKVNREGATLFEPVISSEKREAMYTGWNEAVERSFGWSHVVDSKKA